MTLWQQSQHVRKILHLANRTAAWALPTSEDQIMEIIPVHSVAMAPPFSVKDSTSETSCVTVLVRSPVSPELQLLATVARDHDVSILYPPHAIPS